MESSGELTGRTLPTLHQRHLIAASTPPDYRPIAAENCCFDARARSADSFLTGS
jgi:hypothetical protein